MYDRSVSPKHKKKASQENNTSDPKAIGGGMAMGIGMGQRAFRDMFKEAMEGGVVEVRWILRTHERTTASIFRRCCYRRGCCGVGPVTEAIFCLSGQGS